MSMSDIFRKSFLEGYTSVDISATTVLICLLITAALGLYMFFAYRLLTRKTFYDKNFNVSLPALAVITAAIILTIQSSIVVSLGMVGALSIVRFRTAIKNPLDLVFLFWALSVGIICGAGFAEIAVLLSVVLTVGLLLLDMLPVAKSPMLLVVNAASPEAEEEILRVTEEGSRVHRVKARNLAKDHLDMVIEVRPKDESQLVGDVLDIEGVTSASLLSHDGEVTF